MRNKKIVKFFLLISSVFIFVILFVFLSYLLRPVTKSRQSICGFYAEDDVDVMFVGGSACYCTWQPLQAWNDYGYTSYNFAMDAISPQVVKYAIKEVERYQSPELYVVDLRPFQYGDIVDDGEMRMERVSSFRNFVDNIKYSYNRYEVIDRYAPSSEEKWTYHFDIAKYHSVLINLLNSNNWTYLFNEKKLLSRGFHCHDDINTVNIVDTSLVEEEQVLSGEMNDLFVELLEYCRDNELQVLFVVYPYCGAGEDQKKYNYMVNLIEEYELDYINTQNRIQDIGLENNNDFADVNHVNLYGADKVTAYLGQYLVDNYDLPDHRNEEEYESWNEDYEIWNEEMEIIRNTMQNNNE